MRTLVVFALLIGAPLFYLWEHAYSFRLHQRIAELQEQRQRMTEVCDSLKAGIDNLGSKFRIESRAVALGLLPQFKIGLLQVPRSPVPVVSGSPRSLGPVALKPLSPAAKKKQPPETRPAGKQVASKP